MNEIFEVNVSLLSPTLIRFISIYLSIYLSIIVFPCLSIYRLTFVT